jgi:AcrR family transcriptional regulator
MTDDTDSASDAPGARGGPMRRRLLDAVLEIAGEEGVAAVTNRRVAQRAGTSPGSITYHFASQEELLREALRSFVDRETARLAVVAEQLSGAPGPARRTVARRVAQIVEEEATRSEQLAQLDLMLHAARDPALRETAAAAVAAYDAIAEAALRALGVPAASAHEHAALVVATVDGIALRRLACGDAAPGPSVAAALETLATALTPSPPP